MRSAVAPVDVVYRRLDLGCREVGCDVAADALADDIVRRETGIVQDRGQLHKIGMTVSGDKRIVLFVFVNVIREPRAGIHAAGGIPASGLKLRCGNGNPDHFRFFLIKSTRVMADETAPVRVFPTDVHLHTRKVRLDMAADDPKGRIMVLQIAVDQHEELGSCPGRAAVAGFHIRECARSQEQFGDGYRRVVYIDHDATAVAHQVLKLAASLHHAAAT